MKIISADVESYKIQPGLLTPPLVCLSAAFEDQKLLVNRDRGLFLLNQWLDDEDTTIVLHNGAFDLAVCCNEDPNLTPKVFKAYRQGRIRDTQIRQELIDIALGRRQQNGFTVIFDGYEWKRVGYKLADIVLRHFGKDRSEQKSDPKAWRLRYGELDGIQVKYWPEEAKNYALEDATDTLEVFYEQSKDAEKLGILESEHTIFDEQNQSRAAWALHLASCWGIRTDEDRVKALETKLLAEQEKGRKRLRKCGLIKKKLATKKERDEGRVDFYENNRAMRWSKDKKKLQGYVERWHVRHGLDVPYTDSSDRYPQGQVSTKADHLNQTDSLLLKAISEGGGVDKILTTYVPALKFGTKFPITARFNTLVNSGRTSCSKPNLQNQPTGRKVGGTRECFKARPGYVFISVDYKTQELKALAQICLWLFGESRMAEVMNQGRDLHLAMAGDILKVTYEQIDEAKKKTDKGLVPDRALWETIIEAPPVSDEEFVKLVKKKIKRARDCAKVANFGLPGGLGAQSLVDYARSGYGVIIDLRDAYDLKANWLSSWPEMQKYFNWINDLISFNDEAKAKQFYSNRIRGGIGYCDGCNTFFQGLSADCSKAAMFEIVWEMYCDETSPLFGSRLVAFIHDEFFMESPLDKVHEAGYRMAEIAIREMKRICPDLLHEAEPAAMFHWYKEAETVHDEKGRLIPWLPK